MDSSGMVVALDEVEENLPIDASCLLFFRDSFSVRSYLANSSIGLSVYSIFFKAAVNRTESVHGHATNGGVKISNRLAIVVFLLAPFLFSDDDDESPSFVPSNK